MPIVGCGDGDEGSAKPRSEPTEEEAKSAESFYDYVVADPADEIATAEELTGELMQRAAFPEIQDVTCSRNGQRPELAFSCGFHSSTDTSAVGTGLGGIVVLVDPATGEILDLGSLGGPGPALIGE